MAVQTDLSVFGAVGGTLDPESFSPSGVRGVDKVAQRFVYFLLTPAGSVPGRASDGSPFLDLVRAFRSEFDVYVAFSAAYAPTVAACRAAEQSADAPAERFGSARIAGLTIQPRAVTVSLELQAADGSRPTAAVDFLLDV